MVYLIGQLAGWLLLTAAFAALAGWAYAAQRAGPADAILRRDRDHLVRDLATLASGEAGAVRVDADADQARRLAQLQAGRIAELEAALETARGRADDAAGLAAELQRELERMDAAAEERTLSAHAEPAPLSSPAPDDEAALQAWRLRYFEQRVRYLESSARAPIAAPVAPETNETSQVDAWRARTAEARAVYLEDALRAAESRTPTEEISSDEAQDSPFAANANVDVLLRWRMLYLERRAAHLQAQLDAAPAPDSEPKQEAAAPIEAAPDPDRWKWRARYLESRVRHLESAPRPVAAEVRTVVEPLETPAAPRAPAGPAEKPKVFAAARNGAPDDLRLIDGVSALQQSTLNALGIWHFDQIAAWTPANVAWVDRYLRLQGRIGEEEWLEQAADLAREGPAAARRAYEDEEA